jgi:hypothetical protein
VKYIKILGLAAVTAAALMALIGASTASASTLCANAGGEVMNCLGGKVSFGDNVNDRVVGTSTNATLSTNLANVICSHSETTLNPASSTGTPILGTVEALSFTGCETEVTHTPCKVTVRNLPYSGSVEANGTGGTLTVEDAEGAGANVICTGVIECEFLTTKATLNVVNGSPTVAKAESVPLNHEHGLICPSTATWNATYSVISPTGLTVI